MKTYNIPLRFQHTVLGSLEDHLLYILSEKVLHNRPRQILKATSSKAIQYIKTTKENPEALAQGGIFPLMSMTFQLQDIDQRNAFNWRYGRIAGGLLSRITDPVFSNDDLEIYVDWHRVVGASDVNIFATSYMEVHDSLMAFHSYFPVNRYVYPTDDASILDTYITVPLSLDFQTTSGQQISIDMTNGLQTELLRSINQDRAMIPFRTRIWTRMEQPSDASSLLAGTEMGDYRMNVTITWEMDLPTCMIIRTKYDLTEQVIKNISTSATVNGVGTPDITSVEQMQVQNINGDLLTPVDKAIFEVMNTDTNNYIVYLPTFLTIGTFKQLFNNGPKSQPEEDLSDWAPLLVDNRIEDVVQAFEWSSDKVIELLETEDLTQTFTDLSTIKNESAEDLCRILLQNIPMTVEYTKTLDKVIEKLNKRHDEIWSLYVDEVDFEDFMNENFNIAISSYMYRLIEDKDYTSEYDSSSKDWKYKILNNFKEYTFSPLKVIVFVKQPLPGD